MGNFEETLRGFIQNDIQRREKLKHKWWCNSCEIEFPGNEKEIKCPDCDSNDIVKEP